MYKYLINVIDILLFYLPYIPTYSKLCRLKIKEPEFQTDRLQEARSRKHKLKLHSSNHVIIMTHAPVTGIDEIVLKFFSKNFLTHQFHIVGIYDGNKCYFGIVGRLLGLPTTSCLSLISRNLFVCTN